MPKIILILAGFLTSIFLPPQKEPIDPLENLLEKLNSFRQKYPQEKIHLEFDKPYYVVGDTLFFKSYLVNAANNEPSDISQITYLDVIDENSNTIMSLHLKMVEGISWGSIPLDERFRGGFYRFRSYTNWMRNFDSNFFFDKSILISRVFDQPSGSQASNATPKQLSPKYQIDLFPEGGQIVLGLPATVGVKASDSRGIGIPVPGILTDEQNQTITEINTGFAGLGRFQFTPLPGKKYTAVFRLSDGSQQNIPVPEIAPEGLSLSADNSEREEIALRIAGNQKDLSNDYILIAQSNQQVQFVARNNTGKNGIFAKVNRKRFPNGIVQFTLFNALFQPVAERLVFNHRYDNLDLSLNPENAGTTRRGKMSWSLQAKDAEGQDISGHFSISITNAEKIQVEDSTESSILSDLLLQSDIRGHIEFPQYYFSDTTVKKRIELDNLLLTQGWRRFTWQSLMAGKNPVLKYDPELQLFLSGIVQNEKQQPVPSAKVNLLVKGEKPLLFTTSTKEDGRFIFNDLPPVDSFNYVLEALDESGTNRLLVKRDTFTAPLILGKTADYINKGLTDSQLHVYQQQAIAQMTQLKQYGMYKSDGKTLKEVIVKARKMTLVEEALAASMNLNGPGNADQVMTYKDLLYCHNLEMCLQGKLRGVVIKRKIIPGKGEVLLAYSTISGNAKPMLIIRDGMDMPGESEQDLKNFSVQDIQSIEVLRSGAFISTYGTRGANGIIVITSKQGGIDYNASLRKPDESLKKMVFDQYRGYYNRREFYSPIHDPAKPAAKAPDLRTTVYWKPDLTTDENGHTEFTYYNSDLKGKYRVVVEGISSDGKLGRKVVYYDVN